jgi:SRSO17 transposase
MALVRPRLEEFAGQMLRRVLRRRDRFATGELYVRRLMLDGRRKSMDPMAGRLGVDSQRLQQFMADSPWDYEPVRGEPVEGRSRESAAGDVAAGHQEERR